MAHLALVRRWLAAIALVLFGMGSAEDVFARHWCPHHDGPPLAQSWLEDGHDVHTVPVHGTSASHGGASGKSEAHGCTCVGNCAGAPGTPLPVAVVELLPLRSNGARSIGPGSDALIARQRPAHFLPWSNGPPTLV